MKMQISKLRNTNNQLEHNIKNTAVCYKHRSIDKLSRTKNPNSELDDFSKQQKNNQQRYLGTRAVKFILNRKKIAHY
jgi:hypothetical protein